SSPVGRGTAAWLAEVFCLFGMSEQFVPQGSERLFEEMPFEGNPLTSDPERFRRNVQILEAAPHLGIGSPTLGWLRAAFRSMRLVGDPEYAKLVKVPSLLIAAGNDDIVSSRAVELMGQRLKVGSYLLISESRHEILQERDEIRKQFWAAFDAYMTEAVRPV
ncbi:MAG: alpha/beta hydrolase, partial [Hyphomicrobiaceae bacterium]